LNIAMVLGNAEAIAIAVEEGLGVAFVSRLAAARGIALGYVVEIAIEGMELTRDLYLVRNRRLPLTLAQAKFWEFASHSKSQSDARQSEIA
jgi:DNA-binding transcriptional LysR family regulator